MFVSVGYYLLVISIILGYWLLVIFHIVS